MKCKIKDSLLRKVNDYFEEYSGEIDIQKDIESLNEILENYTGNSLTEYDYEMLKKQEEIIKKKYDISRILAYLNRCFGPINQGDFNICFNKSKRLMSSLELEKIALVLKVGVDNKMILKPSDGVDVY